MAEVRALGVVDYLIKSNVSLAALADRVAAGLARAQ
jgi:hypothetical protein